MEPSGASFREFMQLREDILVLQQGAFLYEFESDGPHLKWFELDATCRAVKWKSSSEAPEWEGKIFLRNIQDLVTGKTKALSALHSSPPARSSKAPTHAEGRIGVAPYVTLVTRKRTMHIAFVDQNEYGTWIRGLTFLTGITPTDYTVNQKDKASRHRTPSYLLKKQSSSSSIGSSRTGSRGRSDGDHSDARQPYESSIGSGAGGMKPRRKQVLSHDDASLLHTLLDENRILVSTCERQARTISELREELETLREMLANLQSEDDAADDSKRKALQEEGLRAEIEALREALAAKDATIEGLCELVSGARDECC